MLGYPVVQREAKWIRALFVLIMVAAIALRLYQLNEGMWLDEILTNVLFARSPWGTIITVFESENQHFLYSLLAHLSFQVFGESTWALRLPAVLFGVGSIWAMYVFAARVSNSWEALLSSALLTFSYTHVWFSQNARGYSGLLFWTLLSSYLLMRALREAKPQLWLLYGLTAALGAYTHLTMVFVMIGQFAVYLWTVRTSRPHGKLGRWTGLLLGFGLSGLCALVLYAPVLPQILGGMGREASAVAEWKDPLWTIMEIVKGMQLSFSSGIVVVGVLAVLGAGVYSFWHTMPEMLILTILPPAIGAGVVVGMGHHLWPRFFFFAMGFGALIVIRGTMCWAQWAIQLLRWSPSSSLKLGIGLCTILVVVSSISVPFAYGPKQDYGSALVFVEAQRASGDAVVVTGLAEFAYKNFYNTDWIQVDTVASLNSVRSRAKRTWLLYTFPTVLASTDPEILSIIGQDFQVIEKFNGTVGDGTIYVCRSDISPSGSVTQQNIAAAPALD